jgi:hypothetical protein
VSFITVILAIPVNVAQPQLAKKIQSK